MVIVLRALCGESDDFVREFEIDADSSFLTLHNFIQENLKFDEKQMASFFLTGRDWNKEQEITLLDMSDGENSQVLLMEATFLGDYIKSVKQRFIYVFDLFSERALFFEVTSIDKKRTLDEALCTVAAGVAPLQILFEDPSQDPNSIMHDDDSFDDLLYGGELDDEAYGDDEFGEDPYGGGYGNDTYGEDY